MITRIKLALNQIEYYALLRMALDELRNPSDQAHHILRQELARRGLLVPGAKDSVAADPDKSTEQLDASVVQPDSLSNPAQGASTRQSEKGS